jgi:DNA-binding MarR family transcriptional regulator
MTSSLQHELHKRGPFDSAEQEAYLSLVRTQSIFITRFERLFKQHGLSQATYNALRVLRGAGAAGRMCHEIGEHLVAQVPDVTRLIDRLEEAGLVKRERSDQDRRVIKVIITKGGLDLLARLDRTVVQEHADQLGHMSKAELDQLCQLLAKAREPHSRPEIQA